MTYKEIKGNQCWSKGGGGGIKQVIKCHKRSTEHYNWGTSVFYCRGATDQYGLPLDFCLRGPPPHLDYTGTMDLQQRSTGNCHQGTPVLYLGGTLAHKGCHTCKYFTIRPPPPLSNAF